MGGVSISRRLAVTLLVTWGSLCGPAAASSLAAGGGSQPRGDRPDKLVVGMIRCNTSTGRVNARSLKRFVQVMQSNPQLDLLIAPEWFLVPKDRLYSRHEYGLIRRYLQRRTIGRNTLVIPGTIAWAGDKLHRNTALAVCNGRTVASYSKKNDGCDAWYGYAYGRKWVPGKRSGVFEWNGLKVGLEICADHHASTLRKTVGADKLDLQIVVSSGMGLSSEAAAVKPGGHMLICDGRDRSTQAVKRRQGNEFVDVAPRGEPPVGKPSSSSSGPFELVTFELPVAR